MGVRVLVFRCAGSQDTTSPEEGVVQAANFTIFDRIL
jgi:hypothetical protein